MTTVDSNDDDRDHKFGSIIALGCSRVHSVNQVCSERYETFFARATTVVDVVHQVLRNRIANTELCEIIPNVEVNAKIQGLCNYVDNINSTTCEASEEGGETFAKCIQSAFHVCKYRYLACGTLLLLPLSSSSSSSDSTDKLCLSNNTNTQFEVSVFSVSTSHAK